MLPKWVPTSKIVWLQIFALVLNIIQVVQASPLLAEYPHAVEILTSVTAAITLVLRIVGPNRPLYLFKGN